MAIVLFKKGTGEQQKFNEYSFEHLLESGWCLSLDEALLTEDKFDPKVEEIKQKLEYLTEDDIRDLAKQRGISHWWTKGVETLRKELMIDDNES